MELPNTTPALFTIGQGLVTNFSGLLAMRFFMYVIEKRIPTSLPASSARPSKYQFRIYPCLETNLEREAANYFKVECVKPGSFQEVFSCFRSK